MQLHSLRSNKSLCQAFEFTWQPRRFVSVYSQKPFCQALKLNWKSRHTQIAQKPNTLFFVCNIPCFNNGYVRTTFISFFSRHKQPAFFINLRPPGYFKQFCDSVYFFSNVPEHRRKSTKINISKAVGACFLIWRLSDKALTRILIYGAFISVYEELNCRDTTQNRHQLWYSYTFV